MGIDSMKITLSISPDTSKKEVTIPRGSQVLDLLKKIQLKPDTLIVLRGNTPIPIDEVLEEAEELRILRVASGG